MKIHEADENCQGNVTAAATPNHQTLLMPSEH